MNFRKAFSLMEIILVVAIIGMLAALVMPKLAGITGNARIKSSMSQIAMIKTALTRYEAACGRYPSDAEGLSALIEKPPTWPEGVEWERYLDKKSVPADPWGQEYVYRLSGANPGEYELFSKGPDTKEGTEDDIDPSK